MSRASAWRSAMSLAVIAALALAGCVDLAPAYRRPASPVPAALPAGGAYPSTPDAPRPVGAWRTFFTDPRLAAVIAQALENNRDLRVAVANVAAARAQYVVDRAKLFPELDASIAATYGQTPRSSLGGGAFSAGGSGVFNQRVYNAKGAVTAWQLDLFGKLRDSNRAALETYFSTQQARSAAQITLIGEVADAWLTFGADQSLLRIAEDTRANGETALNLTQARFTAGVASDLDVSQARTVVEQARGDAARLTAQVARDRNALELLVGGPVKADFLPADIDADGMVLSALPSGVSSAVLLDRPDVLGTEDQLKAANANIGAARAAFFPDISLTGSGGVTSLALSTLFRAASETWSFAPTISQPIFDFGANRGNLAFAKARRDAAVATYEKTVQTAFREVSDALAVRGSIDTQLTAQRALTDAAAQSYRLADARYQRGTDSFLTALVAQRTLYAARQGLVATRLSRSTNLVALYTTLGGGLN